MARIVRSSTRPAWSTWALNVFFAMNQSGDRDCTEANDCLVCADAACTDQESAYTLYPSVIEEALCQVDWDAVL